MRFRDSLNTLARAGTGAALVCACGVLALSFSIGAVAQTLATVATPAGAAAHPLVDNWQTLTGRQKVSLAPLEKSWNSLSEGQRRKWLALAETYPSLGQAEQGKLHSRMVEWAALPPKDREAARLNFAQSKAIGKSERAANWEAYQALSPEERDKLAQGAKTKPVGAAIAVKPVAPDKLTAVPVTRHTPEQERALAASQRPINRNTLLPQLSPGTPVPPVVTTPAKP